MAEKFTVAPYAEFHAAVEVYGEGGDYDSVSLNWETAEGRFHVWLETARDKNGKGVPRLVKPYAVAARGYGAREFPCIYKNSHAEYKQDGYFSTRYLHADDKCNAKLMAEVFAAVDVDAAREAYIAAQKAKNAESKARAFEAQRIEEATALLGRLHKYVKPGDELLTHYAFVCTVAQRMREAGDVR